MARDRVRIADNVDKVTIQRFAYGPTVHDLSAWLVSDLAHVPVHSLGLLPAVRVCVGGRTDKVNAGLKGAGSMVETLRAYTVAGLAPYVVSELADL